MKDKLTDKQEAFVIEYLRDFNGAKAARRAGYEPSGARQEAYRLLTNDYIKDAIETEKQRRRDSADIELKDIINLCSEIMRANIADYLNPIGAVEPLDQDMINPRAIAEYQMADKQSGGKVKLRDPLKAAELVARLLGLGDIKDEVEAKRITIEVVNSQTKEK